jgi:hypothetical protein
VCVLAACQLPPNAPAGPDFGDSVEVGTVSIDADALPALAGNRLNVDGGVPLSWLVFDVRDDETDAVLPARVVFRPSPGEGFADNIRSGEHDPLSPKSDTGAVVARGVLGVPEGVLLAEGQGIVPVPAGHWDLFIHHGAAYEAAEVGVDVAPGEARSISVRLNHSVDTRGWLAADLHVHTGHSFDSSLSLERRAISMVTAGVELIVATDHNANTDLQPTLHALGYEDIAVALVGDEFNFKNGHGGAYPTSFRGRAWYGGAPAYQDLNEKGTCDPPVEGINCLEAVDAFALIRQQLPGRTIVTINHPYWPDGDLGYFTNIGWGAGTPGGFSAPLPALGHFDALEVLNGYRIKPDFVSAVVADWFNLLGRGYRIIGVAGSDTHRPSWVVGGFPRTWLRVPVDKPGDMTPDLLSQTLLSGHAVMSTGPFVDLHVDGAGIGDQVVPAHAGKVTLNIEVDAPSWIHVDTVAVYVNGESRGSYEPPVGQRPVFSVTVDEPIAGDSFIVVVASGSDPMPADVTGEYDAVNDTPMYPLAITNPVFIDADGDGLVRPNGIGPARKPVPTGHAASKPKGAPPIGGQPPLNFGQNPPPRPTRQN